MFANRKEAGKLLYKELLDYRDHKNAVIVTIPRGGVPIGYVLAEKLNLPLELTLSKKIGHPFNKEYAIGAVTLESEILDPIAKTKISNIYLEEEIARVREVLRQRFNRYYGSRKPLDLKDKIVILVDDGVATGNTLISCIQLLNQQKPSEIIIALPVASSSALQKIKDLALVEHIICLDKPDNFLAVGLYYKDFKQVNDEEVMHLMKKANDAYTSKQNPSI